MIKASYILILLGAAMLGIGIFYPLVTLVVDPDPPTMSDPFPADGEIVPSLNSAWATFSDAVSGVKEVYFSLADLDTNEYIITQQPATLISGDTYSGVWQINFTEVTDAGKYLIYWQAGDVAGNWATYRIEFEIYIELQGKWYINDQEIISSTQTVYAVDPTVYFKFVKTKGISDVYISCWVEEDTVKILDLEYARTGYSEWIGNYTFTAGTHNLRLVATDGKKTITLSVVGLTVPGAVVWVTTTQQMLILGGIASIIAGVALRYYEEKRR